MSVKFGLLALFADGPKYGYQLEVRWLDHVESTVLRRGGRLPAPKRPRRSARPRIAG